MFRAIIKWLGISLILLVGCAIVAAYLIDEPLRRNMEANLNRGLLHIEWIKMG